MLYYTQFVIIRAVRGKRKVRTIVNVYIRLKSAGKRRAALEDVPYVLPDGISTLRALIDAVTRREVEKYNSRGLENMLIPFLTEEEIEAQSAVGKVGFGRLYSDKKADAEKAVKTAVQGYEDGLFRVLAGEKEVTGLDEPLDIQEGEILTFIRLTFLAGRLW